MLFSNTEIICKYLYEHHLNINDLLDNDSCPNDFEGMSIDINLFRQDKLVLFARDIDIFNENSIIPDKRDIVVLRQARYMPVRKHCHEYIEFVYLMEGETEEIVNNVTYKMKKGDLFLLAPGTYHADRTFNDNAMLYFIIVRKSTFDTAFLSLLSRNDTLSTFFSQMVFNNEKDTFLIFNTANDELLRWLVKQMFEGSFDKDDLSVRLLNIQFEWFCLNVVRHHISDVKYHVQKNNSISVNYIFNYIESNYRIVDLELICKKFNYSRSQIERLIKQNTGQTFTEFLTRVKMRKACTLLNNHSLTIQNIAEAVGYKDESSFYRTFKKSIGKTPSAYRNEVVQNK